MRSVLLSEQPYWGELIASHKKRIDVRKSRPKQETPFKVYIYVTKKKQVVRLNGCDVTYYGEGKVIGEFVCDRIDKYTAEFVKDGDCYEDVRRVWVDDEGEENFEIVTGNYRGNPEDCELLKQSCLSYAELKKYIGENFHDRPFYTWHISELKIYDKPKRLSEFYAKCNIPESKCKLCDNCYDRADYYGRHYAVKKLERPPQSWCYVENANADDYL